jgi:UDP-N-acetyl-D-glucosamine dehydrogenase
VQVLAHLQAWGATLAFHDPFVSELDEHGVRLRRRRLTDDLLEGADAVLLLTPHSSYDLDAIGARASFVFDARNAIRGQARRNVEVL